MKNAFDMYAKVAPDLVTASARGGVFSLIAVVLMAFMFITETYVFLGAGPVRCSAQRGPNLPLHFRHFSRCGK